MARRGVNKVILVGNLGRDPEVRHLDNGAAVANFPIATSESFRNREGGTTERTEWHNIVMWRGLAETAEKYLKKGSTIYLEGRLITRSWDDAEGNKKYRTEVEANNMVMLDSRPAEGGGGYQNTPVTATSGGAQNGAGTVATPPASNPEKSKQPVKDDVADDLPF